MMGLNFFVSRSRGSFGSWTVTRCEPPEWVVCMASADKPVGQVPVAGRLDLPAIQSLRPSALDSVDGLA